MWARRVFTPASPDRLALVFIRGKLTFGNGRPRCLQSRATAVNPVEAETTNYPQPEGEDRPTGSPLPADQDLKPAPPINDNRLFLDTIWAGSLDHVCVYA